MSSGKIEEGPVWYCQLNTNWAKRSPSPDRFIGDRDAPIEHHFFDVTEAQRERVIQSHTIADDFDWGAMAMVEIIQSLSFSKAAAYDQI